MLYNWLKASKTILSHSGASLLRFVLRSKGAIFCSSVLLFDILGIQEGHHLAQIRADLLQQQVMLALPARVEIRPALLVLFNPFAGEFAILDALQYTPPFLLSPIPQIDRR